MSKQTILVTGGAGYVGSVLVPALLQKGYAVRVFDNLLFGESGLAAVRDSIELIVGTIMKPPANLFKDVAAVIHLAGVSSQAAAAHWSPRYTDLMNHIGTEIMASAAKKAGVPRFVLASSCSIYCAFKYTPVSEAALLTESDTIAISNPYALSKRAAEEALLEMADSNFQPVILRKGTLYGWSPKMRYDLVLNSFTKDAFSKKQITVNAGGEICRPMVDIQDAVAAYCAALSLTVPHDEVPIYNVVNTNQTIGKLAEEFKDILLAEKKIAITLNIRPFEVALNYRADNTKFKNRFNYVPIRTVRAAIMETWGHLEGGHDFTDLKYYNDPWYLQAAANGLLKNN